MSSEGKSEVQQAQEKGVKQIKKMAKHAQEVEEEAVSFSESDSDNPPKQIVRKKIKKPVRQVIQRSRKTTEAEISEEDEPPHLSYRKIKRRRAPSPSSSESESSSSESSESSSSESEPDHWDFAKRIERNVNIMSRHRNRK